MDRPPNLNSRFSRSTKVTDSGAHYVYEDLMKLKDKLELFEQYFTKELEMSGPFKHHYCMKFYVWFSKREANVVKLKDLEKIVDSSKGQKEESADNIQIGINVPGASNSDELDYRITFSERHSQKIKEIIDDEEKIWKDFIRGHEDSVRRCEQVYQKLYGMQYLISNLSEMLLHLASGCSTYAKDMSKRVTNLLCRVGLPLSFDIQELQSGISALIKDILKKKSNNVLKDLILGFCYEILNIFKELLPKLEKIRYFAIIYTYSPNVKRMSSSLARLTILLIEPSSAKSVKEIISTFEYEMMGLRNIRNKLSGKEEIEQMMLNYSIVDSRLSALESKCNDQDKTREDIKNIFFQLISFQKILDNMSGKFEEMRRDINIVIEENMKLKEENRNLKGKDKESQMKLDTTEDNLLQDAYNIWSSSSGDWSVSLFRELTRENQ